MRPGQRWTTRKPITIASNPFLTLVRCHGPPSTPRYATCRPRRPIWQACNGRLRQRWPNSAANRNLPVNQQATVKQAQAGVDVAARNLRLTLIVAPFDGIPNNVESIAVGAFLNAGQSAFPLVSTLDLYIEANIRETDLTYVREGDPAQVTVDAYPDSSMAATVTTLAPASGSVFALLPPQNATGNWVKVVQRIPVRLSFGEVRDGLALRAGMSVKISIDTGHRRSLRELWRDLTSILGA